MTSRSTAPVIADPLIAWPSPASPRFHSVASSSSHSPSSPPFTTSLGAPSSPAFYPAIATIASGSYKGKARVPPTPELRVVIDDPDNVGDEVDGFAQVRTQQYPPPSRPLNPLQLGRIAQSFGIVVPHLPYSPVSAESVRSASPLSQRSSASSGQLIAVLPPRALLTPLSSGDDLTERERVRRWRRGRLVALQPTLSGMLVAIAREFGLPSTTGVSLYISTNTKQSTRLSLSSSSSTDSDATAGPLITSRSWSSLFPGTITSATLSPSSTPSHSPQKHPRPTHSATSDGTSAHLPSPFVLVTDLKEREAERLDKPRRHVKSLSAGPGTTPTIPPRMKSPSSHASHTSSSTSSFSLRTPMSHITPQTSPVIAGTIEFDVDPLEAHWLDQWVRSGGPYRRRGPAGGGMRELTLAGRLHDGRPRFIREMDIARATADDPPTGYTAMVDDDEEVENAEYRSIENQDSFDDPLADLFPSAADEFADLRASRASFSDVPNSLRDIGTDRALEGGLSSDEDETKVPEPEQQLAEVIAFLDERDARHKQDTLASPISLSREFDEKKSNLLPPSPNRYDHRASGIVMADQLDSLEKLMRDLSPRDIRLTSPRVLTPRMAAKIASTPHPDLPSLLARVRPASRIPTSPLATASHVPGEKGVLSRQPTLGSSVVPIPSLVNVLPMESHVTVDPDQSPVSPSPGTPANLELKHTQVVPTILPTRSWPAVSYSKISGPLSSASIHDLVVRHDSTLPQSGLINDKGPTTPSTPTITLSAETAQRMRDTEQQPKGGSEWRPRRPQRPPTPDLTTPVILPHILSPDLVGALTRSPTSPPPVPGAAVSPRHSPGTQSGEAARTQRRVTNSMSFAGLKRQMSARVLRPRERAHAYAVTHTRVDASVPDVHNVPVPLSPVVHSHSIPDDTIGLFRGADTAITGLRDPSQPPFGTAEFGALDRHSGIVTSSSLPVKSSTPTNMVKAVVPSSSGGSGFASKFFSFGVRRTRDGQHHDAPEFPPDKREDSSGLTIVHISSPISDTFKHVDLAEVGAPLPNSASSGTLFPEDARRSSLPPTSPTSPRTVRRKPVPGLKGDTTETNSPDDVI